MPANCTISTNIHPFLTHSYAREENKSITAENNEAA